MSEPEGDLDVVRVSRRLSFLLRHAPQAADLRLDRAGWVPVAELLAALHRTGLALSEAQLRRVVEENDKQRFALRDGRIRAQQGHSVPVDLGLAPTVPPPVLWHGTVERAVPAILRIGLRPGRRHHVHLSAEPRTARRLGARRGRPVVLAVDAASAHSDGVAFFRSGNGVWLADRVPPRYLTR